MKIIFSLLFILFSFSKISACSCEKNNFARNYREASVAAIITIKKIYGDSVENYKGIDINYYKAEIKFDKIYKGEKFQELHVLGKTYFASSTSHEILIKPGEKYIIMLKKNEKGEYGVSACSAIYQLSTDHLKLKEEVKHYNYIFASFEKHKTELSDFKFIDNFDTSKRFNNDKKIMDSDFRNLGKYNLKNKIAVYKVKINEKNKITSISPIIKAGYKDQEIEKIVKRNFYVDDSLIDYKIKTYLIYIDFNEYFPTSRF